jgi:hypothetical protein
VPSKCTDCYVDLQDRAGNTAGCAHAVVTHSLKLLQRHHFSCVSLIVYKHTYESLDKTGWLAGTIKAGNPLAHASNHTIPGTVSE